MVNVGGVIGAGLMGSTHARLLASAVAGAEVVAISDAVHEQRARIADELGVSTIHADAMELIANPAVDAVVIASPAATHEPYTLACIEVGKPVLCEKPLATSAAAAKRIVEAEAAVGRRSSRSGSCAATTRATPTSRRGWTPARSARRCSCTARTATRACTRSSTRAMIITDTAVHEVDVTRWLLGEEIVRATVLTPTPTSQARAGLRDPQLMLFETASGRLVDVEAFVSAGYAYDIRCEIVGEDGTLELLPPATVACARDNAESLTIPPGFRERFGDRVPQRAAGLDRTRSRAARSPSGPSA